MIFLCSASTSRASLLDEFDIEYEQKSVEFDESSVKTDDAREFVYLASKGKLEAARKKYGVTTPILTVDSLIYLADGQIFKKPKSQEQALEMLQMQSGSKISIVSSLHFQSRDLLFVDTSVAHYQFFKFDFDDLQAYIQSRDWQGKTGGSMVEGFCKKYIKSFEGLESTARGLQVEILLPWIELATKGSNGAI